MTSVSYYPLLLRKAGRNYGEGLCFYLILHFKSASRSGIYNYPGYAIIYLPNSWSEAWILEALEVARKAVDAASEKQASDIVLLDARKVCSFADYFVICTGESERQTQAIYEEIEHSLKKEGVLPFHHEGRVDSGWLLLDYGDVIVHIFAAEEREYYQLDKLWSQANLVLRIQ